MFTSATGYIFSFGLSRRRHEPPFKPGGSVGALVGRPGFRAGFARIRARGRGRGSVGAACSSRKKPLDLQSSYHLIYSLARPLPVRPPRVPLPTVCPNDTCCHDPFSSQASPRARSRGVALATQMSAPRRPRRPCGPPPPALHLPQVRARYMLRRCLPATCTSRPISLHAPQVPSLYISIKSRHLKTSTSPVTKNHQKDRKKPVPGPRDMKIRIPHEIL